MKKQQQLRLNRDLERQNDKTPGGMITSVGVGVETVNIILDQIIWTSDQFSTDNTSFLTISDNYIVTVSYRSGCIEN